ncbi:MAG: saccharopine dehydrogenase [Desulfobacteraceae bacterium]|nr:saccharopine dehydrogenase [Desulfobacteraceae bacterium]
MEVIVLGGGLVGGPMAMDLAKDGDIKVTIADSDAKIVKKFNRTKVNTIIQDLSDTQALKNLLSPFDMVVSAVPGFMGYKTLETIINCQKDVVDIAFFPEDALTLDELAKKQGVTAIVDCGVAPGMSHLLLGYANLLMDTIDTAVIYVGGLPRVRTTPWEYKAVFSPLDVIEEYLRPAFFVEKGKIVERPALSDPELIEFPGIGTLEAFNTDGLRSLTKTLDIPNLREKTMRYPGHIQKIKFLKETGFFNEKPIVVKGQTIRPLDMTTAILFPQWEFKKGEEDITIMRVLAKGTKDGKKRSYTWDLLDTADPETCIHSMARTTGYTATMALRMIKQGLLNQKGVIPPEFLGRNEARVAFILDGLKQRDVIYTQTMD